VLDHPVVTRVLIALTHLVALEYHRRLVVIESVLEIPVLIVPGLCGDIGAAAGVL